MHDFLSSPAVQWIPVICACAALIAAAICFRSVLRAPKGNRRMEEIAGYIRSGAMTYLRRQYSRVGIVFIILFAVLVVLSRLKIQNPFVPVAFLTGGFFSALCGFLGMTAATIASGRTAQGASESLNRGLQVAFRSGAVMGLLVVGFGLLDISVWYIVLDRVIYSPSNMQNGFRIFGYLLIEPGLDSEHKLCEITMTMLTFGMGASTQALFARVGGGIFTKAADVGADLVGKVEAGIPEDDPRNPAVIADNVGDNVGDVAGMGADLYESYCGSILATSALGAALPVFEGGLSPEAVRMRVLAPMLVAGLGILSSIIGIFFVRARAGSGIAVLLKALRHGMQLSVALILLGSAGLVLLGMITPGMFGALSAGLAAGILIGLSTEYYTSNIYSPTHNLARQAQMGPGLEIISGLSLGMLSSWIPVLATVLAMLAAYALNGGFLSVQQGGGTIHGLYGIGFAAVGMLSTLGILLASDAYGPVADNAGGNAEMSGLPPQVRERTDMLDMLGNTTAAAGKGFAIGSAALTAMALLAAEIQEMEFWGRKFGFFKDFMRNPAGSGYLRHEGKGIMMQNVLDDPLTDSIAVLGDWFHITLMNPYLLCGLFIGAMMAFVFCALTLRAIGRASGNMVEEVRRQFRTIPGIMDGSGKPDYDKCIEISTRCAQREMMLPAALAILVPLAAGLLLGPAGVLGLLAGALTCSFALACMLNNAGCAWDNAKKFIENGNYGGRKLPDGTKNPVHGAAVIGDTVGDPCKDTAGPSLNILVKLMSVVSIVFTPLILKYSPEIQRFLGIFMEP